MRRHGQQTPPKSLDGTPALSGPGFRRRAFVAAALAASAAFGGLSVAPAWAQSSAATANDPLGGSGLKWAASWATAIQGAFVAPTTPQGASVPAYNPAPDLSFALPNATTDGVTNQTMRMIISPTSGARWSACASPTSSAPSP